ncbi:MAG: glucose-6-phosphate isomerase [Opitutales bacterium]|nr:glucose-6-phosphate isomerase [Opitutales bacterium]
MSWEHFKKSQYRNAELAFGLDYSRMDLSDAVFESMEPRLQAAYKHMLEIEGGAIANPDEERMVGHYWLRNSQLAPSDAIRLEIEEALKHIQDFCRKVHSGEIQGEGGKFTELLVIGIGGSALGPQFVAQALGQPDEDRMRIHFFDNTDPDGLDLALAPLRGRLSQTLCLVISKSGGTPETRNGMLEASQAFLSEGLEFGRHAVAITGVDSRLDQIAVEEKWLDRFPMWDWVGGRTSELATVGLLPAALQGLDIGEMLEGAAQMDTLTRGTDTRSNPAALLALCWYQATGGKGKKDMVILPYKDRLMLFSKYLQQLIMESLGKEKDLDGKVVHQGIAVYGNKGSTDQHAYVQQLRDGINNFFATFIQVLKDREGASIEVDPGVTSGDYLNAFLLGTRQALSENARQSITLTIDEVNPRTVGMLIALYERAVGLYAHLVNINAYHQPGVEAGKKAASNYLHLKSRLLDHLQSHSGSFFSIEEIAAALDCKGDEENLFKLLEHLVANPSRGAQVKLSKNTFDSKFGCA